MSVPPGPPWRWPAETNSTTTKRSEQQQLVYQSEAAAADRREATGRNIAPTVPLSSTVQPAIQGRSAPGGYRDRYGTQQELGARSTFSGPISGASALDKARERSTTENRQVPPPIRVGPGLLQHGRPDQAMSGTRQSSIGWPAAGHVTAPVGARTTATHTAALHTTQAATGYAPRSVGVDSASVPGTPTTWPARSATAQGYSNHSGLPAQPFEQPLLAPARQPESPTESTSKLSPNDIPRPATVDRAYHGEHRPVLVCRHEYGRTMQVEAHCLPISMREAADTFQVDRGNARPRFIRWTVGSVPQTPDLARSSGIPLALYIAPFADAPDEEPLPVVDTRPLGPLRCSRCHAYVNVGIRYTDGGRSFVCNLCHHLNTVDVERFVPIDPVTQLPSDYRNRADLQYGSVEYIVPEDMYCERGRTSAPVFVLVADAPSLSAIAPYTALREMLSESLRVHQAQLALIVTSSSCLHLFPVHPSGIIQEIVVPDTQEPFLPVPPTQLLQSSDLEHWTAMMDYIQRSAWYATEASFHGSHILAGVIAAAELLRSPSVGGGKILAICSGLPLGPQPAGLALRDRWLENDETASHRKWKTSVERERWLIQPVTEAFARLGERLADAQIVLDLFLFPSVFPGTSNARPAPYFDIASLRTLPEHCGGTLYYHRHGSDIAALHRDLLYSIRAVSALEAILRVRCSPGITTGEHLGSFRPTTSDRPDICIPVMGTNTNLFVAIRHDVQEGIVLHPLLHQRTDTAADASNAALFSSSSGETSLAPTVYVQVAVLFTSPGDRTRRVRVHTLAAPGTSLLSQLFRTVDVTTLMGWLARRASASVHSGTLLSKVRDHLTEQLVEMLFVYRRYCASRSSPGQLILPEALKVAPLYTLGLLKSAAFRAENVLPDERAYRLHLYAASPLVCALVSMHPLMLSCHGCAEQGTLVGLRVPGGTGGPQQHWQYTGGSSPSSNYPKVTAGTTRSARSTDAIEHEEELSVPDGEALLPPLEALTSERLVPDSAWLVLDGWQCFLWIGEQVDTLQRHHAGLAGLPLPVLERLYRLFPGIGSPEIVHRQAPAEQVFRHLLIEDRASYAPSYIEYLVTLHKLVQRKLASNEAEKQHRMLAEWEWAHTY